MQCVLKKRKVMGGYNYVPQCVTKWVVVKCFNSTEDAETFKSKIARKHIEFKIEVENNV